MTKNIDAKTKVSRYSQLNVSGEPTVVNLQSKVVSRLRARSFLQIERSHGRFLLNGPGWTKDVSSWLEHPEIADAIAFALDAWSPGRAATTIDCRIQELEAGFWQFLRESDPDRELALADLSTRWLGTFIKWLGGKDENGEPLWSPGTRSGRLIALRVLFKELKDSDKWAHRLAKNVQVPSHPWPGGKRLSKPREVLDDATLLQLLIACRDDALATMSSVNAAWEEVEEFQQLNSIQAGPLESVTAWRAAYLTKYGSTLRNSNWLEEHDREMFKAQRRIGVTYAELWRPYIPRAKDLVPFVMLLAYYTSFNPDALRALKFSEIDYPEDFGGRRIRLRPFKGRAHRKQIRTFAIGDPLGPEAIVSFLTEWTGWLRNTAPAGIQDRLFLMGTVGADNAERHILHVTDFFMKGVQVGRIWFLALETFLEDNDLPPLSLAQIRPTSLDRIHELTNGDLKAVQLAGGQRSPQVILDHYTSDAMRKRNDEKLALVMQTRDRLVQTNGTAADPRKEPYCWRRCKSEPPRRSKIEPGVEADLERFGCG